MNIHEKMAQRITLKKMIWDMQEFVNDLDNAEALPEAGDLNNAIGEVWETLDANHISRGLIKAEK
jgi:hypothetical protein